MRQRQQLVTGIWVQLAMASLALVIWVGTTCTPTTAETTYAAPAAPAMAADIALVIAVDVSQSVDDVRYRMQMEGIAQALEDPEVLAAILSGPRASILVSLIVWADQPHVAIPWQSIANETDARRVAELVRALPQQGGEFTCVARLLHFVRDRLADEVRGAAARLVVDISGDGIDNCGDAESNERERDALVSAGTTINGLPIMVAGENDVVGAGAYRAPGFGLKEMPHGPASEMTTLDQWFRDHVIGGPGAFLLEADGYEDFGRAIRRKFVIEISSPIKLPELGPWVSLR